jgi:hypothetical protein
VSRSGFADPPDATPVRWSIVQKQVSCTAQTNRGWCKAVEVQGPSNILAMKIAVDKATTAIKVTRCKTDTLRKMVKNGS